MSCILVGNGTSLLDSPKGEQIDQFDHVVRFNQCDPQGYAKYTGKKTNTLFMVNPVQYFDESRFSPLGRVFVYSWQPDELCGVWKTYQSCPLAKKVSLGVLDEIKEYFPSNYSYYSSGALAAWVMLKEFPHVVLTGFDWWEREKHHYSDEAVRGAIHQPSVERQFFAKLEQEGRLSFL